MEPLVCVNCLFLDQSDGPFTEDGHMVQKSPCLMENDAFFLFKAHCVVYHSVIQAVFKSCDRIL